MNAELLSALIARNDEGFVRRAIRWLDLPVDRAWLGLDDNERSWLVKHGIVQDRVSPTVRVAGADYWRDEWSEHRQASWPKYALEIHGAETPISVLGWHYCRFNRYGRWVQNDQYESDCGTPLAKDWTIRSGDGLDSDRLLPVWRADGQWVTFDRDELNEAICQAAKTVDHGKPSTTENRRFTTIQQGERQ